MTVEIYALGSDDEQLLERFYRGIYLAEFAAQREPLESWKSALRGDAPYRLTIQIARDGGAILGGIAYELYPRSRTGLVTYMVVAPEARAHGLGKQLRSDAARTLYAEGARAVFGEVNDPRVPHSYESTEQSWQRLERNQRWGSRVVATRYVQPALGPGLDRDRGLLLLALAGDQPLGETMPGIVVREFVEELFDVTERRKPDAELREILDGIAGSVPLILLAR